MGTPLLQEKRRIWEEKIKSQQESGFSIRKWCKENQLAPHVFYYWKRRLFPNPICPGSFAELTDEKRCSIEIEYQAVHIRIEAPTLKKAFQALRELKC